MGRWTDLADWIGDTPNRTKGAMAQVIGVAWHIQQGNEAGTEAWQRNPKSEVSSHFLGPKVAAGGRGRQMVDTADRAWAEAAGNSHWLSIEFEGWAGQSLTADQVEFGARVLAKAHQVYGVPLHLTEATNIGGLGWHGMGGTAWGGHFNCPGAPIRAQRADALNRAIQLVGGAAPAPAPRPSPTAPPWPGRVFVYRRPPSMMSGRDVMTWQQRMRDRGWNLGASGPARNGVDGYYGSNSRDVCLAFQREKGLQPDGRVGPITWAAAWTAPKT